MKVLTLCVVIAFSANLHAQSVAKMELWRQLSHFRGFVISPNVPISQQDILFVKNTGATLAYIATDGFWSPDAPYSEVHQNIDSLDARVGYCQFAGLHYAIAVRQGPGRYDV
ncbi:MAG: hypothetical protein ACHQNE_08870, partial [Candidatus Kapaibacterium sp.]